MTTPTRRGLLGALGTGAAALAGCSSPLAGEESTPTPDRTALAAVADIGVPAVPRTSPAQILPPYLADRRDAVEATLATVPATIPEADVPNGVVRAALAEARSRAVEHLTRAEAARTAFERLEYLRNAVGRARTAAAGYRYVTEGLTREAVFAERPATRDALESFRERRRVVGDPDGASVVLHATVDGYLAAAASTLEDPGGGRRDGGRALVVGSTAGDLALAAAFVADAAHLNDRYAAARGGRPLWAAFERASDPLLEDVRRRRDALPPADFDEAPTAHLDVDGELREPTRELLQRVHRAARYQSAPRIVRPNGIAGRLLAAREADGALRTYERVARAVEAGAHRGPLTADDVRGAKLGALAALERARHDPAHPALAAEAAEAVMHRLRRGDERLRRSGGHVGVDARGMAYVTYVHAAATAATIPASNDWLVGAVRAAVGG